MANVDEKVILKNLIALWNKAEISEDNDKKLDQQTVEGILEASAKLPGFADFRKELKKCITLENESPGDDEYNKNSEESAT